MDPTLPIPMSSSYGATIIPDAVVPEADVAGSAAPVKPIGSGNAGFETRSEDVPPAPEPELRPQVSLSQRDAAKAKAAESRHVLDIYLAQKGNSPIVRLSTEHVDYNDVEFAQKAAIKSALESRDAWGALLADAKATGNHSQQEDYRMEFDAAESRVRQAVGTDRGRAEIADRDLNGARDKLRVAKEAVEEELARNPDSSAKLEKLVQRVADAESEVGEARTAAVAAWKNAEAAAVKIAKFTHASADDDPEVKACREELDFEVRKQMSDDSSRV